MSVIIQLRASSNAKFAQNNFVCELHFFSAYQRPEQHDSLNEGAIPLSLLCEWTQVAMICAFSNLGLFST